jgi:hypothetical protein
MGGGSAPFSEPRRGNLWVFCHFFRPQIIVRVLGMRSGNMVEVETVDKSLFLCRVPSKFNKLIWIKRGA